MIFVGLLFGALALFAVSFWKEMVAWLKKVVEKVKEITEKAVAGFKIFVKKIGEAIKEISKNYSQDQQGRWHETIVSREIPESEVPADILAKVRKAKAEVDVTEELQLQLEG
jgi:hypothetical protein